MRTLIGPMVCKGCRAHVWGVDRRTVEQPCKWCGFHTTDSCQCANVHTHAVPASPFTVVGADGTRHECAA
jgi:hypothetical protein